MDPALAKEISLVAQNRAIQEAIDKGSSEIQQFYKGTTVFITGGSGFLGKQLIEKLFRSTDIKKIYMLMRPKKKWAFHERLAKILEDPLFDTVKKQKPDFVKKLCPVQGDASEPGLGLSLEEKARILEEVDVIIHGAATVNFDEPLKVATFTNVRGTVEMLNLAKKCKKLKSFVHVSTAYSHCTRSRFNKEVLEKFYDAPLAPSLMIEMAETMEEKRLNDITPELISDWPNTYTFTKAIAEQACKEASDDLPITIVRPAIVIASQKEPSPGWMDVSCINGPSGLIYGVGLGMLHVVYASDIKIDLVPVDCVNNAIIAAGWAGYKNRLQGISEPKLYTVTSMRNYTKWNTMCETMTRDVAPNYATPSALYHSFVWQTNNKRLFTLLFWLLHFIPGYLIDFVCWLAGKKQLGVKLYTKAYKLCQVLGYFTTNEWYSSDRNLVELYSNMSAADKLIYNCDMANLDWKVQCLVWCLGVRKYLMKDGLQGTEKALRKQFWLKILNVGVVAPLYLYALYKITFLALSFIVYALSFVCGLF